MNMHSEAEKFSSLFTEPIRSSILEALRHVPPHMVPQVKADSLSPWIIIDVVPGPKFAIWRETADLYLVGDDGAVYDKPIFRIDNPLPEGL